MPGTVIYKCDNIWMAIWPEQNALTFLGEWPAHVSEHPHVWDSRTAARRCLGDRLPSLVQCTCLTGRDVL